MVALTCVKFNNISKGHGRILYYIDAEELKYGEQTGLETLVVHTLNYEY
jgi:hypothetical protein